MAEETTDKPSGESQSDPPDNGDAVSGAPEPGRNAAKADAATKKPQKTKTKEARGASTGPAASDAPETPKQNRSTAPSQLVGKSAGGPFVGETMDGLLEPDRSYWAENDPQNMADHIDLHCEIFNSYLEYYKKRADAALRTSAKRKQQYRWWKGAIIILTGSLAIQNILVANGGGVEIPFVSFDSAIVEGAVVAAILSAIIGIVVNFDSFFAFADVAETNRSIRELYLDAHREYETRWVVYVESYGCSPEACLNATRLLRAIQDRDLSLRNEERQLSRIRDSQDSEAAT